MDPWIWYGYGYAISQEWQKFQAYFQEFFPNLPWRTSVFQLTNKLKLSTNDQATWIHSSPRKKLYIKTAWWWRVRDRKRTGKYSFSYDFSFLPLKPLYLLIGPRLLPVILSLTRGAACRLVPGSKCSGDKSMKQANAFVLVASKKVFWGDHI